MKKYFDGLALLTVCAWVGGMWVVGYLVTPVLFQSLPDKALAGMVAGKLFTVAAYMGMVCAIYLLIYHFALQRKLFVRQGMFWIIVVMVLFLLVGQYGIQPMLANLKTQALPLYVMDSPFAEQFKFWHGVSSIIFLTQSLFGAVLLLKQLSTRT